MYFSVILIILFLLYYYRKKLIYHLKNKIKIIIPTIILILIMIIFIIPKTDFYKNIITSLNYYNVDSISDLISIKNIDNIIYSNRLDFLANVHQEYINS